MTDHAGYFNCDLYRVVLVHVLFNGRVQQEFVLEPSSTAAGLAAKRRQETPDDWRVLSAYRANGLTAALMAMHGDAASEADPHALLPIRAIESGLEYVLKYGNEWQRDYARRLLECVKWADQLSARAYARRATEGERETQ